MSWFDHQHGWRAITNLNTVKSADGKTTAALIIEECACGAVRTIEYSPEIAPIVRYAEEKK